MLLQALLAGSVEQVFTLMSSLYCQADTCIINFVSIKTNIFWPARVLLPPVLWAKRSTFEACQNMHILPVYIIAIIWCQCYSLTIAASSVVNCLMQCMAFRHSTGFTLCLHLVCDLLGDGPPTCIYDAP